MTGLARCALCRREVEFDQDPPRRCRARDGGCGAAGAMVVKRSPAQARQAQRVDLSRPSLSELACQLEEAFG